MKKKHRLLAGIILGIGLVVFLILGILCGFKIKSRPFGGMLFENSGWLLTWEGLYEVCESAKAFDVNNRVPQAIIWYDGRKDFNADIERFLQYVMRQCEGDFYYGTRGDIPEAYISKPKNTGAYEEELSWVSVPNGCLSVRLVRIGNGVDALMKIIIENEPLKFLDGMVIKSDNTELIVEIDCEQVRLSWNYVTGKRFMSETTPLYQPGDKVRIGILEDEEIQYYSENEYGTLGMRYLGK